VRPCVGRTDPLLSGSQSIWFLNAPLSAPCSSGETQTCPSDHSDSARSSATLPCPSSDGSRTGRPCGSNVRTSQPSASRSRANSKASSLEKARGSRKEPYSTRMRGGCAPPPNAPAPRPRARASSGSMSRTHWSPGPEPGISSCRRCASQPPTPVFASGSSVYPGNVSASNAGSAPGATADALSSREPVRRAARAEGEPEGSAPAHTDAQPARSNRPRILTVSRCKSANRLARPRGCHGRRRRGCARPRDTRSLL